jgi:hypothetical protein
MRTGTKHSAKTRKRISKATRKALQDPIVRDRVLKTAFKKGNDAWNKDLKGIHLSPQSEFKEGITTGKKHPSWKGGVQKPVKDCAHLWAGTNKRLRRPKVIYEEHHGKLTKGYVIYHIDGNNNNDDIDNLEAITRAELLKRNAEKHRMEN